MGRVLKGALFVVSLAIAASLLAGASQVVKMEGMQYMPSTTSVQRGDTVTWRNDDLVPHTVTAQGAFDSGNIEAGKSFSRRMDQPGRFDYVCTYHPGMKGQVLVK